MDKLDFTAGCTPPFTHLDLSRLPVGGVFSLGGKDYEVLKVTEKRLTLLCGGKRMYMHPTHSGWPAFIRDVQDLLLGSCHGVDAGCLTGAIVRE